MQCQHTVPEGQCSATAECGSEQCSANTQYGREQCGATAECGNSTRGRRGLGQSPSISEQRNARPHFHISAIGNNSFEGHAVAHQVTSMPSGPLTAGSVSQ